jgi:hypothetical protein
VPCQRRGIAQEVGNASIFRLPLDGFDAAHGA